MSPDAPPARKRISARKATVLALLDAERTRPLAGRTRMQKLVFLVQRKLLGSQIDIERAFKFDYAPMPEKFGPADLELYQDLDFLQAMALISIDGQSRITLRQEPVLEDARRPLKAAGPASLPEEEEEDELSFEYLMGTDPEELFLAEMEDSDTETVYQITPRGHDMLATIRSGLSPEDRIRFDQLIEACALVRKDFGVMPLKRLLRFVYENYENFTHRSTINEQVLGRAGTRQ